MNKFKCSSTIFCAALFFILIACNSGEETSADSNVVDSNTTSENATTASTLATDQTSVVTTPENIMIVKHKISNFSKFKASYDAHDSLRLANGIHSYVIGRGLEDSNLVMVALKVEDLAKAKAFSKDPSLKEAMRKAGVTGPPSFRYSTVVYQDNASGMADLRSMTTFTVKDWDAWKTSFESSRQIRRDNGLTDRAYGYDAEDNHKVTLVVAINDSAKATAFWNSDQIKEMRAKSGVIGQPDRFVYRVVQKY